MKSISIYLKMICLALLNMVLGGLFTSHVRAQELNDYTDTLRLCRSALPVMYDTLLVEDAGDYLVPFVSISGTDSIVHLHVIVTENPVPHITGDTSRCENSVAIVMVQDTFAHVIWSTGDERYYAISHDNFCMVEVTDRAGCKGTARIDFVIYPSPVISVTGADAVCYGDTTLYKASGNATLYTWQDLYGRWLSFSDSLLYSASVKGLDAETLILRGYSDANCSSSIYVTVQIHPVYEIHDTVTLCRSELPYYRDQDQFDEAGTYPIHYQSVHACDSIIMLTLVVNENPDVRIQGTDSICDNTTTILTVSGAVDYLWSTQSTHDSIEAYPDNEYWVIGVADNGCSATDSIYVNSWSSPVITIEGPTDICYGQSDTLSVSDEYEEYLWSTGDTVSSIGIQPIEDTDYQVTVVNQHGCQNTATTTVSVRPNYESDLNITVCSNELPFVYHTYSFNQAGNYDVTLTTEYGCDSLIHLHLSVIEGAYALISGNTEICPGASTQLSANGNGTFLWSTGGNRSPITVDSTGWYVLTVTATNGCKAYDSVEVTSLPLPQLTISGPDAVCRGDELLLMASGAYSYSWNTGVTGSILSVIPNQSATYVVTGTSARGCTATATHYVRVNPLPTASISGVDAICQGGKAIFTANGGSSYLWSTGATTASVQLTVEQLYTVEVTNQYGCVATASKYLEVNNLPTVSIIGQDYFCEGSSSILNATGTGAISYVWNNTSIGQSYEVSQPGIYTVMATSSANCTATASIAVARRNGPEIAISGNLSFCDGENTQLTATGGQQYTWRNLYGAVIANTATVFVNEGGLYTVTATDNYGCTASQQVITTKKNLPNVNIIASDNEVCEGNSILLSGGYSSGYSYKWNTGASNRQIEVNTPGVYVLQVTANGCTAADSIEIVIYPRPNIVFSGDTIITTGETTTVYATAPQAVSYHWNTGANVNNISVSPSSTTDYTVEVTNLYGCSGTETVRVVVVDTPIIVGNRYFCEGDSTLLQALGGVSYLWNDGITTASRYVSTAGSYSVTVTNSEGYTASTSVQIAQHNKVQLQISGNTGFCVGDSVALVASGANQLYWSNGQQGNRIVVYESGTYTVNSSDDAACALAASQYVSQYALPEVNITGQNSICQGDLLVLTATSNESVAFVWNTGATGSTLSIYPQESTTYQVTATNAHQCTATTSTFVKFIPTFDTTINVSCCSDELPYRYKGHEFNQSGLYDIYLPAGLGCDSTIHLNLTVNSVPSVSIVGQSYFCEGGNTVLYAYGADTISYVWNNTVIGQSCTVSTPGTYTVRAITAAGCSSTASISVTQYSNPVVSITGDTVFCDGQSTQLTASGGQSYSWRNAYDAQLANTESISLNEGGIYYVVVTDANACTSAQSIILTKKSLPNASIIATDIEVCEGTPVTLRAGWASDYSYLWSTGSTERQIVINEGGTYSLQVTANGCTAVDSTEIIMYPLPDIVFTGDTIICHGNTAVVYASAPNAISYQWETGATEDHITTTPYISTTYSVLITNSFGCSKEDSVRVAVEDNPVAIITSQTDSICVGQSIVLQASGGVNYLWDNGDTSAEHVVSEAGVYTVKVYTAFGCVDSASKTIYQYEIPEIIIDGNSSMCEGDSLVLTAHGGDTYLWSNGSTDTCITVFVSGIYTVEGWDTHACSAKDTLEVSAHSLPEVQIVGTSHACSGSVNTLTALSSTAVSYLWNTGSTSSEIQVNETAEYSVIVRDSNSCHNSASFAFEVMPPLECSIIGPAQICQGDTAILTASDGVTFIWSTLDSTASIRIAPDTTTTYNLMITDSNGCIAYASKQVVVKIPSPITIHGADGFCEGDSTLIVAEAEETLVWSNGHIGDSIMVYETGIYTVQALDSSSCGLSSSKEVTSYTIPEVYIEGSTHICFGDTGWVHAVSDKTVSYLWTTGSTDSAIAITSTNVYGVTVTDAHGCSNETSMLIMAYSNPTVSINGPSTTCNGEEITLTATTTASHFHWSTGDSTASIRVRPRFATNYDVVVSTEFGCTATASWTVSVISIPIANITGDTVLCEGEVGTLTCSNASSFHWSTGANTRSINVSETGTYSVVVTNTAGCTNSASIFVNVYEQPRVIIYGDSLLCRGAQTVLTATGGSQYLWSDGTTTPYIAVAPETNTVYSVQVFNHNCVSSASRNVVVHDRPTAHIDAPDGLCPGTTIRLNAQGGQAYLWSTGQTSAMIDVANSGTYQLIAFNEFGCMDTTTHTIIQYPQPQVAISGASAMCANSQETLYAIGTGSYLWNTGDTSMSIVIHQTGYYQVQLTDIHGCTATTMHAVTSLSTPSITILGPSSICVPDTIDLSVVCTNASSFQWNTGATSSSIEISPNVTTTYTVTAVSSDNCIAEQSHTVTAHSAYNYEFSAEICQGQSYTGNGFFIPIQTESGDFTFTNTYQSVYGCDSIRTLHLRVNATPVITTSIAGNATVNSPGNYVYMIDPVEGASSYEWILSNPNWNLTFNQTIAQVSILSMGTATLSVYALNECGQSLPMTMQISYAVGIDEAEMQTISVYPNPTNGMVNVKLSMNNEKMFDGEIQLLDMYGKLLNKWEMSGNDMQLDLSSYASGVYMLKLHNSQNSVESVVKVVKR